MHMVNAAPFPSRFQGAVALGQCQNPTECEHIRRLPCGQLLRSGGWRRAPPPPISKSQTENSGEPRCRPAPATRNGRAPFGARTPTDQEPITQPEMPERTHATAPLGQRIRSGRAAADPIAPRRRRRSNPLAEAPPSRARGNDHDIVNAAPFPSRFQGAVALGQCQNPTECEHIRRLPCGQLLRSGGWRRAPPPPISKSQTENSGEPRCRPASATRNGRAPFGARTPTDQEPITQPEMPERTHATAPLGQRIRSGRAAADPIAPRRRRRSNPLAEAPPSRARGNDHDIVNAAPFPSRFQGAVALGQCQNPTECEHIRRLPCGQLLRAAVGEGLRHRRSPSPKQKTAAGLAVGQHRRPALAARRSAPAHPPIKSRSPSRKCQSAHTPQPPSASGFDRVVPRPTR